MDVTFAYARLNIQLDPESVTPHEIADLQELLHDSALWAEAEDVEVFYSEKNNIVGISIPVEEDPASILEAGAVLGMCQRAWEDSETVKGSTWLSLITPKGEIIYSPLGY